MGLPLSGLQGLLGAPGGTAPTFTGGGPAVPGAGTQPEPNDQVKQLIVNILKQAQQGSKSLAQPVPAPIPQARKGEWGDPNNQFQQLMHSISGNIQGAIAQHKQQQLAKAEADWNQLTTAMQSGNQPALNAILTDPKKLKLMAKALNQDWLNPEKTDVYREALKKVLAEQQKKGQATQGLMGLFRHLIGRATQPQLNDQQKQQMAQEIQAKAPISQQGGMTKEGTQLLLEEMKEAEKGREAEAKEAAEKQKQEWTERRESFKAQQQKSLEDMKERHSEALQSMRDSAAEAREDKRIVAEMKMLGMKEADKFRTTPSELNKSMNSTVSSLNSQYSAAQANVRKLEDNVTKTQKMIQDKGLLKFWKDDPDIEGAQNDLKEAKAQAERYKRGSDFIARNRQKVLTGKADWDDVLGQAQAIMEGGDLSDLGGEKVK